MLPGTPRRTRYFSLGLGAYLTNAASVLFSVRRMAARSTPLLGPFRPKFSEINTCANRVRNSFRMRTYELKDLISRRMRTYKKRPSGQGASSRATSRNEGSLLFNPFRITSLWKDPLQLSWNDIVAKKEGGGGRLAHASFLIPHFLSGDIMLGQAARLLFNADQEVTPWAENYL